MTLFTCSSEAHPRYTINDILKDFNSKPNDLSLAVWVEAMAWLVNKDALNYFFASIIPLMYCLILDMARLCSAPSVRREVSLSAKQLHFTLNWTFLFEDGSFAFSVIRIMIMKVALKQSSSWCFSLPLKVLPHGAINRNGK